jgi:hypothetical protein
MEKIVVGIRFERLLIMKYTISTIQVADLPICGSGITFQGFESKYPTLPRRQENGEKLQLMD